MSFLHPNFDVIGIDVSKWQGMMDWKRAAAKVSFAYIRSSDGLLKDTQFERNWNESKTNKIPRGAYHFFRIAQPIEKQVDLFVDNMRGEYGELPPILDVEAHDGADTARMKSGIEEFIRTFERRTRLKLGLYTSKSFWESHVARGIDMHNRAKWVAHYTVALSPNLPTEWNGQWTFWQKSADGNGKGREYGATQSTSIDLNIYNGTIEQFAEAFKLSSLPTPQDEFTGCTKAKITAQTPVRSLPAPTSIQIGTALRSSVWPYGKVVKDTTGRLWLEISEGVYIDANSADPLK